LGLVFSIGQFAISIQILKEGWIALM